MVGLLAAIQAPERFAQPGADRPLPRYVNDPPDYVGGFERADIEGLLEMMDKNYIGWANILAPVDHGERRPARDCPRAGRLASAPPTPTSPAASPRPPSSPTTAPTCPRSASPRLVLQCAEDVIAPACVGEYVARHLPQATFVQMEATGHCPQVSHPQETVALIRAYLEAQAPR